ncbi:MAG: ROK family protein [Verrucomicrobiota bacterium]
MSASPLFGAIEAGGTKFVLGIGTGPEAMRDTVRLPTTTPAETLAAVVAWFQQAESRHGKMAAIGVGTFGPAGVHRGAGDYGFITTTPKPFWENTDVLGALRAAFPVPMGFDTDVNAAALGEWRWGAGQGCGSVLYLTVGTGIGGGALVNGRPVHGLLHPEMGHIRLPRAPGDTFAGACPWHGDCLEGMASGPALIGRWGPQAAELPPGHEAWEMEAHYLACACVNFLMTLSPQRCILGGGVMGNEHLLPLVRARCAALVNRYLAHPVLAGGMENWLVAPGLGTQSGLLGSLALAEEAFAAG